MLNFNISTKKTWLLSGVRKAVNPPYDCDHTEDSFLCLLFKFVEGEQFIGYTYFIDIVVNPSIQFISFILYLSNIYLIQNNQWKTP